MASFCTGTSRWVSRRRWLGAGVGAAAILGGVTAKAGLFGRAADCRYRRGGVHLRPANRDELRGAVCAGDRQGSGQYRGPFNALKSDAAVFTYKDTSVVTPNSDTPYGFAALDLRAEPMVISVPAVERERYYAVQLCDGNTSILAISARGRRV